MKTTFTHTTSTDTYSRNSKKALTHVVVCKITEAHAAARGWDDSAVGEESVWGWHTSAKLAEKKISFFRSCRGNDVGNYRVETING